MKIFLSLLQISALLMYEASFVRTAWSKPSKAIFDRGLSSREKTTILARHNHFRRRVARGNERRGRGGPQPGAANMKKLVTDILYTKHFVIPLHRHGTMSLQKWPRNGLTR